MNIALKPVNTLRDSYVDDLVDILNNDKKLIQELGGSEELISSREFVSYNNEWADKNKAKIFAIILDDKAIGLISLSRINKKTHEAGVGYWIASKYWNHGYTSKAFEQLLNLAKEYNIRFILGTISKDNKKSLAIWKKFNARFETRGDNFLSKICL